MTYVYRAYGDDGRLLYVGIAEDVEQRFKEHERGAGWVDQLVQVDVEWHTDRKAALAAESEAIKSEWPLHNIAGSISGCVVTQLPKNRLGWEERAERVRRAFYPDPLATLKAIADELVADNDLCAEVFALLRNGGAAA